MAEEFPIDPEFNRFIEGMPDPMAQAQEGAEEVELPELTEAEIEELPDGSAVVKMPSKGPMENEDFYRNLAEDEEFDSFDLMNLDTKYQDLI